MDQGQEMFYYFFMGRVKDDKKEEAKSLLADNFAKQADGTFDKTYFREIMPRFLAVVKPEAVEEVKDAMNHFASSL